MDIEYGPLDDDSGSEDGGSSSYGGDEDVEVGTASAAPPPPFEPAILSSANQVQIITAPINFLTSLIGCSGGAPQQQGDKVGGSEWKEAATPGSINKTHGEKPQTDL